MNDAYFDHQLNIQTEIYYESYSRGAIHRYEPTDYIHLEQLFQKIKPLITVDDVFVDIGSGMHRVPIFAAHQLQVQTKGIEINKQLYMHALKNIQAYSKHHRCHIDAINCDILDYNIKAQDSIFFLFNPFSVHIFKISIRYCQSRTHKENYSSCIILMLVILTTCNISMKSPCFIRSS